MLVFINTINHKVISLLTQVQKQPQKKLLGPQRFPLLIFKHSWKPFNMWPQTLSSVPLCQVKVK